MPLKILLAETIQTFAMDGASFSFVPANAGHTEDSVALAGDGKGAGSPEWTARYNRAFWGLVLRGWTGIEDAAGRPVPFEAPPEFRDQVRAAAIEAKEPNLAEDTLAARAQGAWVYHVVRSLPSRVKAALQAAIMGDTRKAEEALGN